MPGNDHVHSVAEDVAYCTHPFHDLTEPNLRSCSTCEVACGIRNDGRDRAALGECNEWWVREPGTTPERMREELEEWQASVSILVQLAKSGHDVSLHPGIDRAGASIRERVEGLERERADYRAKAQLNYTLATNSEAARERAEAERNWLAERCAEGYGWDYGLKHSPCDDALEWIDRAQAEGSET